MCINMDTKQQYLTRVAGVLTDTKQHYQTRVACVLTLTQNNNIKQE